MSLVQVVVLLLVRSFGPHMACKMFRKTTSLYMAIEKKVCTIHFHQWLFSEKANNFWRGGGLASQVAKDWKIIH